MGVRTLYDRTQRKVAFYDSVTGRAFGPIIEDHTWIDDLYADAETLAEGFLKWCVKEERGDGSGDLRGLRDDVIEDIYQEYLEAEHQFQMDEIIAKRGDGDSN